MWQRSICVPLVFLFLWAFRAGLATAQEQKAPPPGEKQLIRLKFDGGSAADLVDQIAKAIGYRVVLAKPIPQPIPALQVEAETRDELFRAIARAARVIIRDGYLLTPRAQQPAEQPAGPSPPARPLGRRDHQKLPFVRQPDAAAGEFLPNFAGFIHMPIVVEPPAISEPIAIDMSEVEVVDVLRTVADYLKRDLVPVYVAEPVGPDVLKDILAGLTDEDLLRMSEGISGETSRSQEERRAGLERWYANLMGNSPSSRSQQIQMGLGFMQLMTWRLDMMAPQSRQLFLNRVSPLINDAFAFYRGLPPSGRTEIKPIFDFIQQYLGGQG